jgi:predicted Zn-dependent protease
MVDFTRSDDELAFVVAHEMAHNILDRTNARNLPALMVRLGLAGVHARGNELNADAVAVGLMVRAGYNPSMAEVLLGRLREVRAIDLSLTHPGLRRRIAAIRLVIARTRTIDGL